MRSIALLLITFFIVGCQKDNSPQEITDLTTTKAGLTFEQISKEESDSHVILTLDSSIFKKYLSLAEAGDASAQARVSSVYAKATEYVDQISLSELLSKNANSIPPEKTITHDKDALFKESDKWNLKAAENGDPYSQYQLGSRYEKGIRLKKDVTAAIQWYEKAVINGFPSAASALGDIYNDGKIVSRNCEKSLYYYSQLKKIEDEEPSTPRVAHYYLNDLFEDSTCAPKKASDAFNWYNNGSILRIASAMNNLGLIYEYGKGVSRDMTMAANYYEAAANLGYAVAQYNIGLCYTKGLGVIKDNKQAYFWMLLASAKEYRDAIRMREQLERLLSPEERSQTQAEAKKWKST